MLVGAHVSIAGGLHLAPERAAAIGCECFQLFTRSPQGGAAPALTDDVVAKFRAACAEHEQQLWVVHTPYYINLASPEERTRAASIRVIREELERASRINATYVMTHLGSARDVGEEQGRAYVIEGLVEALRGYTDSAQFLIEISAGAGAIIGDTFEEVADIIERVEQILGWSGALQIDAMRRAGPRSGGSGRRNSSDRALQGSPSPKGSLAREAGSARSQGEGTARDLRGCQIGVCFDTQHAFASGYDLRTPKAVAETMRQFDETIGLARLKMSHIQDSKCGLGEHKDRHEHIGRGHIGIDGLRACVQGVRSRTSDNFPLILETEDGPEREEDVQLLKGFRG